jgi:hypothetical protein
MTLIACGCALFEGYRCFDCWSVSEDIEDHVLLDALTEAAESEHTSSLYREDQQQTLIALMSSEQPQGTCEAALCIDFSEQVDSKGCQPVSCP